MERFSHQSGIAVMIVNIVRLIQLNTSLSSNFRICSMQKLILLIQHINSSGAS